MQTLDGQPHISDSSAAYDMKCTRATHESERALSNHVQHYGAVCLKHIKAGGGGGCMRVAWPTDASAAGAWNNTNISAKGATP